jgi:hypothetical protein
MPENLQGFADLGFNRAFGQFQPRGNFLIFQTFQPVHLKDSLTFGRKAVDYLMDPVLQFYRLDLTFEVLFIRMFLMDVFQVFFLNVTLVDIIDATVVNRSVQVGLNGNINGKDTSFFVELNKKILHNFLGDILVCNVFAGKNHQRGIILPEKHLKRNYISASGWKRGFFFRIFQGKSCFRGDKSTKNRVNFRCFKNVPAIV